MWGRRLADNQHQRCSHAETGKYKLGCRRLADRRKIKSRSYGDGNRPPEEATTIVEITGKGFAEGGKRLSPFRADRCLAMRWRLDTRLRPDRHTRCPFRCLHSPRRDLILRNARVSCKTPSTHGPADGNPSSFPGQP